MVFGCSTRALGRISRSKRLAASALDDVGADDLERHHPIHAELLGLVHRAHRPLSEETDDLVAAGEGLPDGKVRHGHTLV